MRSFRLNFEGSLLDKDRKNLPTYPGIYLVYRGFLMKEINALHCTEIIYIGQAEDIRRRHSAHEKRSAFINTLQKNEVLFYSYAKADLADLDRIENALVYFHKPILNDNGKNTFLYPATEVISEGQCALLERDIIINGF